MDFKEQVDKKAIFLLFGCYCNNPRFVLHEKYITNQNDYPENFHKMIWGAIVNIAKKGNIQKITPIDIENEISQFGTAFSLWKNNNGWEYIQDAIDMAKDKGQNIGRYYDDVRKYSVLRNAVENLKLDISFIYDENDETVIEKFQQMSSKDILNAISDKFLHFKDTWKSLLDDSYSFHVGDDIKHRLEEHKKQQNVYGYPFQSAYLTTVYRGMRPKKFIIRSSVSGGGKTRNSLADACNMSCDKIFDWNKHDWVSTGEKRPVLFISTELTKEEIQDCLLAHISGVEQDRIEEWQDITAEEESVIDLAAKYVKDSSLYGEYMPDFTIEKISDVIESYVINKNIFACFFDYINDSPSLYAYYYEKTKIRLRTDQILFLFSNALKMLCNKYNIFLGSSTQLNNSYKENDNKDGSALKGSTAIIEKADGGVLALPVSHKDLKKLKPILDVDGRFGTTVPNMSYYVFKNRGGKWKSIIIWTRLNLGTMRECDCFVTNYNFELIENIERTIIDFTFDDVGETVKIDSDLTDVDGVEIASQLAK